MDEKKILILCKPLFPINVPSVPAHSCKKQLPTICASKGDSTASTMCRRAYAPRAGLHTSMRRYSNRSKQHSSAAENRSNTSKCPHSPLTASPLNVFSRIASRNRPQGRWFVFGKESIIRDRGALIPKKETVQKKGIIFRRSSIIDAFQ